MNVGSMRVSRLIPVPCWAPKWLTARATIWRRRPRWLCCELAFAPDEVDCLAALFVEGRWSLDLFWETVKVRDMTTGVAVLNE